MPHGTNLSSGLLGENKGWRKQYEKSQKAGGEMGSVHGLPPISDSADAIRLDWSILYLYLQSQAGPQIDRLDCVVGQYRRLAGDARMAQYLAQPNRTEDAAGSKIQRPGGLGTRRLFTTRPFYLLSPFAGLLYFWGALSPISGPFALEMGPFDPVTSFVSASYPGLALRNRGFVFVFYT